VHAIVESAIENEIEFITEALPVSLIGMSSASMSQYIKYVGDMLLRDLGYSKLYGATNPFDWMEMITMDGKTNFFESRVSEYARASVISGANMAQIEADDDDF
jgi:ribonucleoside-diphosphate reductase beta chain